MSVDLVDTSSDSTLSSARADPLSKRSLFIVIGSRGCKRGEKDQVSYILISEVIWGVGGGGVIINYVDYLILLLFDNSVITCTFESERVFFPFTFSSRCSRRLIIQWPLIFLFLPPASSRHPTPTRGLYTHMCMCLLFIHSCVGTETKDSIFHQAFLSASPHLHECFLRITLRQENHLHSHSHTLLHAALLS